VSDAECACLPEVAAAGLRALREPSGDSTVAAACAAAWLLSLPLPLTHADHVVPHCSTTSDCLAAAAAAAGGGGAGDVRLTRMVIFGALLGVLDPVLTLAAAEAAQGDVLRMPSSRTLPGASILELGKLCLVTAYWLLTGCSQNVLASILCDVLGCLLLLSLCLQGAQECLSSLAAFHPTCCVFLPLVGLPAGVHKDRLGPLHARLGQAQQDAQCTAQRQDAGRSAARAAQLHAAAVQVRSSCKQVAGVLYSTTQMLHA
jgi:hypothetical protein